MVEEIEDPSSRPAPPCGQSVAILGDSADHSSTPPRLGEHTEGVLGEL
jgi:hypothetical protein